MRPDRFYLDYWPGVQYGFTLTFAENGGTDIADISRLMGATISLNRYAPTKEGHTLTGWYADEALTQKLHMVRLTQNTTVYAGWESVD